jgi:hypothetical protein
MKVELTAISKQSLEPPTATSSGNVGAPSVVVGTIIMAQFSATDGRGLPQYGAGVFVPYELVEGAKVGDVFTLHLERAK